MKLDADTIQKVFDEITYRTPYTRPMFPIITTNAMAPNTAMFVSERKDSPPQEELQYRYHVVSIKNVYPKGVKVTQEDLDQLKERFTTSF